MQVLYQLSYAPTREEFGDEGTRTPDILLAKQALYQLSYIPRTPRSFFGSTRDSPCLRCDNQNVGVYKECFRQ